MAASIGLLLSGCTVALEPAYDERIVSQLEALSTETAALFSAPPPRFAVADYPERREVYGDLAARAATVQLLARARPAPSGRLAGLIGGLLPAGEPDTDAAPDAYGQATVGYMDDYRRNLDNLAERDRERFEELGAEVDAFRAAEAGHLRAISDYADAYAAWLAGDGPRPGALRAPPQAPPAGLSDNFVERRRIALMDVLLDALVYEREILDRTR